MKKAAPLLLAMLLSLFTMAQNGGETFTVAKGKSYSGPDSAGVYTFVEQNPEYPGGDAQLINFLQQTIRYPAMERDNNIQGRVLVRFVVNEEGGVSNIVLLQKASPGFDKEAVRVVKLLRFKPAIMKGKPVKVYFNLPVVFKLP